MTHHFQIRFDKDAKPFTDPFKSWCLECGRFADWDHIEAIEAGEIEYVAGGDPIPENLEELFL